jgi:plastocyanin
MRAMSSSLNLTFDPRERSKLPGLAFAFSAAVLLLLPTHLVSAAGADETVIISGALEPGQLEVDPGTTVTWHNEDPGRHRVRSDDGPERFDSKNLDRGESFSFTFTVEGSYPYYDHRNPDETAYFGVIVVGGAETTADGHLPDDGTLSIIDRSFRPPSFAIATGGTIEWSNDDGEAHTVTSTDSAFDSGILNSGATFSQTFAEPGSYPYFCAIHPEMRGTISVSDPVDDPALVEPETIPDGDGSTDGGGGVAAPDPGTAPGAIDTAPTVVSTIDRSFQPASVEVAAGDTVTWSNDDTEGHTVTAIDGAFNSGVMTVGVEFSMSFDTPGTFDYFCAIHPEMTGTVVVTEPDPELPTD